MIYNTTITYLQILAGVTLLRGQFPFFIFSVTFPIKHITQAVISIFLHSSRKTQVVVRHRSIVFWWMEIHLWNPFYAFIWVDSRKKCKCHTRVACGLQTCGGEIWAEVVSKVVIGRLQVWCQVEYDFVIPSLGQYRPWNGCWNFHDLHFLGEHTVVYCSKLHRKRATVFFIIDPIVRSGSARRNFDVDFYKKTNYHFSQKQLTISACPWTQPEITLEHILLRMS